MERPSIQFQSFPIVPAAAANPAPILLYSTVETSTGPTREQILAREVLRLRAWITFWLTCAPVVDDDAPEIDWRRGFNAAIEGKPAPPAPEQGEQ